MLTTTTPNTDVGDCSPAASQPVTPEHPCSGCGGPTPYVGRGRPRKWCEACRPSDAELKRSWEAARRARRRAAANPVTALPEPTAVPSEPAPAPSQPVTATPEPVAVPTSPIPAPESSAAHPAPASALAAQRPVQRPTAAKVSLTALPRRAPRVTAAKKLPHKTYTIRGQKRALFTLGTGENSKLIDVPAALLDIAAAGQHTPDTYLVEDGLHRTYPTGELQALLADYLAVAELHQAVPMTVFAMAPELHAHAA